MGEVKKDATTSNAAKDSHNLFIVFSYVPVRVCMNSRTVKQTAPYNAPFETTTTAIISASSHAVLAFSVNIRKMEDGQSATYVNHPRFAELVCEFE